MKNTTAVLPHIRLDFNIKHPALEECYIDGYANANAGIDENANPFRDGTLEAEQWSEGWWSGYFGEEPIFDLTSASDENVLLDATKAHNDDTFFSPKVNLFLLRFLEISGALAVSAILGYQIIDMVA